MLSKKITVLYPILHYPPVIGGLEQWTQNIAERQPDDIRILVVTGRVRGETNFEKRGNVTIFRTSLFVLSDLSHSSIFYIASAFPFIVFRSLLFSKNVDLFHCHGFVSALIGYFLSIVTGKPFIGTEQSIIGKGSISKFATAVVYKKARLCISSGRAVGEGFKKIGVKNVEIIPNGVDLEKFMPKDKCSKCGIYDIPHQKDVGYRKSHIILSVGRLEKVKGHKYLIEALAILKKEGRNVKLILVGDGSERRNLERQAEKLGIKSCVQFIGAIEHDDLPHYYHMADIFVMPSLSEGFGITAIEAMAAGLPVVLSNVGGLVDIIEGEKTGLFVQSANSGEIAAAVCRLWKDCDLKERLGNEARTCIQKYDWDSISTHVRSIYRKLVN